MYKYKLLRDVKINTGYLKGINGDTIVLFKDSIIEGPYLAEKCNHPSCKNGIQYNGDIVNFTDLEKVSIFSNKLIISLVVLSIGAIVIYKTSK